MATLSEIDEAVTTARAAGCRDLVLLKCTSTYPATPANTNISTIPHMREMFGCEIGISDHTMGVGVAVAAVAHGATVVEKHVTLRRSDGGVDSAFSLEPDELRLLVVETKRAWESLGSVTYGPSEVERKSLQFRRSIYFAQDMPVGAVLTKASLRIVRPAGGLHPRHYEQLVGKRLRAAVTKGTPVHWDLVD